MRELHQLQLPGDTSQLSVELLGNLPVHMMDFLSSTSSSSSSYSSAQRIISLTSSFSISSLLVTNKQHRRRCDAIFRSDIILCEEYVTNQPTNQPANHQQRGFSAILYIRETIAVVCTRVVIPSRLSCGLTQSKLCLICCNKQMLCRIVLRNQQTTIHGQDFQLDRYYPMYVRCLDREEEGDYIHRTMRITQQLSSILYPGPGTKRTHHIIAVSIRIIISVLQYIIAQHSLRTNSEKARPTGLIFSCN